MCARERKCHIVPQFGGYKGQGLPDRDSLAPIRGVYSDFYILLSCSVSWSLMMSSRISSLKPVSRSHVASFSRRYDTSIFKDARERCMQGANSLLDGVVVNEGWQDDLGRLRPLINVVYSRMAGAVSRFCDIFSQSTHCFIVLMRLCCTRAAFGLIACFLNLTYCNALYY